ncbi:1225_t:CDS:2 [Funneliformis geosporum]|uniref:16405_t:CDS:1 n=1 Tax=Funneliformis geosporum TaxID=1117311 RepID=A0A9W4SZV8_9GLOM|nr:16405_t:CDS:2 [Funneliformis geosporum]CAI2187906.1 1225_t:CDS:2 [Funneliformis geosporum]
MTCSRKQPQNNKHSENTQCHSRIATPVLPEKNDNSPQLSSIQIPNYIEIVDNQDDEPILNTCITISFGNKLIEEDMKRFEAENDALIFVNKELGGINDD